MNKRIVKFGLGLSLVISSAVTLANEYVPDLLWELTDSNALSQVASGANAGLKISKLRNDVETRNNPELASQQFSVNPNRTAFEQLAINQEFRLPLPGYDADVRMIDVRSGHGQQIWTFSVSTDAVSEAASLPKGKLFLSKNSISAWIPGLNGTWRLADDVVKQEMKWATDQLDYKVLQQSPVRTQGSTRISPLNEDNLGSEASAFEDNRLAQFDVTAAHGLRTRSDNSEEQDQAVDDELSSQADYGDDEFVASVKVLFVFTPEFAESTEDAEQTIEQWLEINNEIYQASGIRIRLEVADVLESELEEFSSDQILDNLAKSDDPNSTYGDIDSAILEEVWEQRLASGADLVTVLTYERPDGVCGTSWLNGSEEQVFDYRQAYNLVSAYTRFSSGNQQACSFDTLGHEVGHNMGLAHSHEQGQQGSVFHYGRGYGVEDEFSTVMAYPQAFGDAAAVPFYSSPELECADDLPCGVNSQQSDGADAVKALNLVSARVTQIHNDEVTMHFDDALSDLDNELADCVDDAHDDVLSNEEVTVMDCPGSNVSTLSGLENFPRLRFISVNRTDDISLEPFKRHREIIALDFRFTRIEDLRPIAHLKDQLEYLQFFSENMSCQDEMVAASWGIEEFRSLRGCEDRNDDDEDFDGDGIDNLNDVDDDNDGIDDLSDALPRDNSNAGDMDADGVPDDRDAFPYDPEEYKDTDRDTIGNNEDDDDDNDGFADDEDCAPLDPERAEVCEKVFVPYDFDGDSTADVAVRRASIATQYILNSSNAEIQREELGRQVSDIAISGDFDGDKIADLGVRRPSERMWYIRPSSDKASLLRIQFGLQEQDIPVPADYDGDGITDVAVRRPSTFQWFVLRSSDGEIGRFVLGRNVGDIPVPADYDGDGLADVAVRRPGNQIWYILRTSDDEIDRVNFGLQEQDIPVPADYDGDGITDIAVRRPSTQLWYILRSSDNRIMRVRFGLQEGDIPIVADYDGDGKADIAVRRPSVQTQFILRSSDLEIDRIRFGLSDDDMPLAAPVSVRFSTMASVSNKEPSAQSKSDEMSEFDGMSILTTEEAIAFGVIRP